MKWAGFMLFLCEKKPADKNSKYMRTRVKKFVWRLHHLCLGESETNTQSNDGRDASAILGINGLRSSSSFFVVE